MNDPRTLIDRYTAAATALDAEALVSLYAPDVRLYDLMMPWKVDGTGEWRTRVDNWFGTTGESPVVEASDIQVTQTGEMALLTMNMLYSHVEEGERHGMLNRLTWVAVPRGDDWMIVHEHTSVPLSEPEMQPVFEDKAP